ncbi:hypothetical protein FHS57_006430 [Runella defluvii]|uniref:Uncharacterized protein n=1 Tax=Runella defluvii TaxID=370973 RepID=A0A7W6EU28_9BACT|nr:DUF3103 family protein [Runella defluvii]MBB3842399.1 hypothetical protein [Runella defluvii]
MKTTAIFKNKLFLGAFLISLIASSIALVSCEDSHNPMANNTVSHLLIPTDKTINKINKTTTSVRISSSETELDLLTVKFTKALAKSLKNEEVRGFLKLEAQKKFDGDFDILFSKSKDLSLSNKKITDILIESREITASELQELMRLNFKLNIAIPINIEKWDTKNQAPLVTFIPSDYVENETITFLGFDFKGEQYLIDAIEEPNVPVIVVGSNERMDYKVSTNIGRNLRTSGNYERVEWIRCPNLSNIEGWANGAPEIRFDGVIYNIGGASAMQACSNIEYVPSRSHAKDGYTLASWTATQNLFRWYFDTSHGPNYYIQTFEVDNSGSTQTTNVSVTYQGVTSTIGLTYKEDDKKMKGELINSSHPSPATIADGNIEFVLEN